MIYDFFCFIYCIHEFDAFNPSADVMHILLADDDPAMFDSFTRKLNEMWIIRTHDTVHLYRPAQLLPIALAKRLQIANRDGVDPRSLKLFSNSYG